MILSRNIILISCGLLFYGCVLVSGDITLKPVDDIVVNITNVSGALSVTTSRGYIGVLGRSVSNIPSTVWTNNKTLAIFKYGDVELRIAVVVNNERWQIQVRWNGPKSSRLEDCFELDPHQWFGGPEQKQQYWPVQKLNFTEYSYITKEDENNAITEPYWINSQGTILFVDRRVPLFIDQNNIMPHHLCFVAQVKNPYSDKRDMNELLYDIVFAENAKTGHQFAIDRYLGKPIGYPDFRMIQHPVWSTWARYSRPINESVLMTFANEIIEHKFNNSQFEIDDFWENCYGSLIINTTHFPDFKKTVQDIKALGFRVTLWIHPFINEGCEPWFSTARDQGYLVKNESGSIYTSWWNSNGDIAAHIDFTNPEATNWFMRRVMDLQTTYDLDSFKFDAGESSWTPQIPVQRGATLEHPGHITMDYVRAMAEFGPMIEVRSGLRSQDLPVFVRMLDKDTLWTFDNGLPTLVTTLLQMNMNGYPLVLPDMIGGNGYNEKPSKELFIRWLQANVFMPTLQFSFVPWDYDNETIEISRKFTSLHAEYAELIREEMEQCVNFGKPLNPPIWWMDPTDEIALTVWDEFLVGERILVAPILEKGAVSRDIYLPRGVWINGITNEVVSGGSWIINFSAPLDTLPFFISSSSVNFSGVSMLLAVILSVGNLLNY